jgi:hypothetical protein
LTEKFKCNRCKRNIVGHPNRMGNPEVGEAVICDRCYKIWMKIFNERVWIYQYRSVEREMAWRREFSDFLNIDKVKVQFT